MGAVRDGSQLSMRDYLFEKWLMLLPDKYQAIYKRYISTIPSAWHITYCSEPNGARQSHDIVLTKAVRKLQVYLAINNFIIRFRWPVAPFTNMV